MLVTIGRRTEKHELADLLLECHDRIRYFSRLAVRVATEDASDSDRADASRSVARYFGDALPRHIADEEESILPRLRGRDPTLDAALAAMQAEHGEHERSLAELVELTRSVAERPEVFPSIADRLRAVASHVERALSAHLEAEEQTIVPGITRLLGADERAEILGEMRARRPGA
jgi:hemerythrin-like domain-containing protein